MEDKSSPGTHWHEPKIINCTLEVQAALNSLSRINAYVNTNSSFIDNSIYSLNLTSETESALQVKEIETVIGLLKLIDSGYNEWREVGLSDQVFMEIVFRLIELGILNENPYDEIQ